LSGELVKAITGSDLVAAAVLSGNRNFEGRIHPYVRANYLASPPLVVAYAIAGTVDIDLSREPLGIDREGTPVYLWEIWPTSEEIQAAIGEALQPEMFAEKYSNVFSGNLTWNSIQGIHGEQYLWDPNSTYIQEPPFFATLTREVSPVQPVQAARVLAVLET
jgi:aconitate hydratase